MSATNRGAVRRDADFYPTPAATTLAILRAINLPGGRWLEPSAGEGAIIRAVNSVRSDVQWTAVELREACVPSLTQAGAVPIIADFINGDAVKVPPRFNVAILNPPFVDALLFLMQTLTIAEWVVCLQRINFLGGKARNRFWREHAPDVYVLPERPSFTGEGSDATEYAWLVWPPDGHDRAAGRIEVLPASPRQAELF